LWIPLELLGEAIVKTGEKFYNLALIDIRLPDMDGVNLLTKIKETKPKMRKVMDRTV
jgi:YesN/AraC family two-component response regulator